MRRLIIWDLITLDGCFEGPAPWSLDFRTVGWGDELDAYSLAQLDEVGALLFDRRTFEGMADCWFVMNQLPRWTSLSRRRSSICF